MHAALQQSPQSYTILHAQCDFLLSKNKPQWAQAVAQQAVNSAPSEFVTWAKLTETYIELGQYDAGLLTLNSCPMFTFNERDLHRMPTPARTHLPVKKFISDSNILDEESSRDNEVGRSELMTDRQADVALLRLPAPGLRGTFAKAYVLLAQLVSKIGWDELLKTRSTVFVMEEEYRLQKTSASVDMNGQDDEASTTALRSPQEAYAYPITPDIPTIRISSESTRGQTNGVAKGKEKNVQIPDLEKPETAQATDESGPSMPIKDGEDEVLSAFSNKRLCERWLGKCMSRRQADKQTICSCMLHSSEQTLTFPGCCMRIFGFIPYGGRRFRTLRPSTCRIEKRGQR